MAALTLGSTGASADEVKSPWSSSASLNHYGGFRGTSDPFSTASYSGSYTDGDRKYVLSQSVNKFYAVDPSQREVEANDAQIGVNYRPDLHPFAFDLRTGLSASIPISEFSRKNGVWTALRFSVGGSRDVTSDVSVDLSGFARYQFNEYKTTKPGPSGLGGSPMPWFSLGYSAAASYAFHDRWTLDASGGMSEVWYEKTERGEGDPEYLPDHPYNIDVSVTRKPEPNIAVSLGISQGTRFEQGGRLEFVLIDSYAMYWFLGGSYTFN